MSVSDLRRFGGISRLYGPSGLDALHQAHVCVIGVGGVGSWAVEALARSGVGTLTLIDLDHIAISNVNRQLHALTPDFGQSKIRALAERIGHINPQCTVHEIDEFIDEDNLPQLLSLPYHFAIDAIDQTRVKVAMIDYWTRHQRAFVISGSAGGQRNIAQIHTNDLAHVTHDPMLAKVRYALRRNHGFNRKPQQKMRVPCVFSTEQAILLPTDHTKVSPSSHAPQGLSCAGYGASMLVTASFGLRCAQEAIEHIIKSAQ